VLAFVSKPTFDPNLFVDGIDTESWKALNESIEKPLLNRALRGTYPPGSTYKPFMAMAALQTGKRAAGTVISDNASYTFGGHTFRSHGDIALGAVDMYKSIVKSSNVYYYSLANELGVDAMHDFMKRRTYKRPEQKKWYLGETISLGIGQGYNTFTMLQLAQATAVLANNGIKHKPRLVLGTQDTITGVRHPLQPAAAEDLGYKPENVAVIRKALVGVTLEGTSARVFSGAGYVSGGKTGTAQAVTIGQKDKYNGAKLEEHQRDHAVYMAFAPADKPQIALAVIVENAGWGAGVAAPIARRVFDYVLLGQYPSEEDMAAVRKGLAAAPIGKPRQANDVAELLALATNGVSPGPAHWAKPVTPQDIARQAEADKVAKAKKTAELAAKEARIAVALSKLPLSATGTDTNPN
jgi:penicillin-binding protein 2